MNGTHTGIAEDRRQGPPGCGGLAGLSDAELLGRFTGGRDGLAGPAFAALVGRYGPMVLATCRVGLGDDHDAEDAFQVTFLVLARKAGSIRRPDLLGPWLHGVAFRTARKARALAERRRRREGEEPIMPGREPVGDPGRLEVGLARREAAEALHEEIARLPEHYRVPVLLCEIQGLTHAEAASRLRCPVGSLSVRLMRARGLLRGRLTRRGLAPTAVLLALGSARAAVGSADIPPRLAEATVRGALRFAEGHAWCLAGSSDSVATLARQVLGGPSLARVALHATAVALAAIGIALSVADIPRALVKAGPPAAQPLPTEETVVPSLPVLPERAPRSSSRPVNAKAEDPAERPDADPEGEIDAPGPAAGVVAADPAGARGAGRDADAQVRLALRCEANGLAPERLRHLALAVVLDPSHRAARGLLGQLAYQGRWRSPDDVAVLVREDTQLSASLAEYVARRSQMEDTADGHWRLALWCEQRGLEDEARAHLVAVTRRDPGRESAWKRLGRKRHAGRWLTEGQIAAERDAAEAQARADRRWRPLLAKWRGWLREPARRDEAERALAMVSDPLAVAPVWALFGGGDAADQTMAVQLLGQLDSPEAARPLAALALASPSPAVRRAANETLSRRDPRRGLAMLVGLLRDPNPHPDTVAFRYSWVPAGALGIGSPGITLIEGKDARLLRWYTVDETRRAWSQAPPATAAAAAGYERRIALQQLRQMRELEAFVGLAAEQGHRDLTVQRGSILRINAEVIQALRNITRVDRGDDWEAWVRWWVEDRGYAYEPDQFRNPPDSMSSGPKPTFVSGFHLSCFAAGTPVRTLTGLRPIESIRTGDRVLTQDTTTGALSFAPVLGAVRNKPAPTLRIDLGGEPIVATGIHRFWVAGRGWVMARDLKPGDRVRSPGGLACVSDVSADREQPVFNLEVGEGRSYFVGAVEALVHDNSSVDPVAAPFDAPAAAVARGSIATPLTPARSLPSD